MSVLENKLALLPEKPGVYIYKDRNGHILYIGKALSLRQRVRSYFQASADHSSKVRALVQKIHDLEIIVTNNEVDALILESNLIKEHQPWFNIRIKDDKHYPYLKLTMAETYPRLLIARRIQKDGSKYFGPYPSSLAMRETLKLIRRIFPLRTCKQQLDGQPVGRPCLNYHIKRCLGPCTGKVSREEYMEVVQNVDMLLSGRYDNLIKQLTERMEEAAAALQFERAAELRDQLKAIERISERQKMISPDLADRDVFAVARGVEETCIGMLLVREGHVIGREHYFLTGTEDLSQGEILAGFLKQHYANNPFIPREVILSAELPDNDGELISEWLTQRRGSKAQLIVPKRGDKKLLVEMAEKNAALALEERLARSLSEGKLQQEALQELARFLELAEPPRRIECYDISNISGKEAVGSMVVMINGEPQPSEYRRFRIRDIEGPNDYAMMQQVLRRRFRRLQQDDERFSDIPDLIIIDGGKGQLSAALQVLHELGFAGLPVVGLAEKEEHIFRPGHSEPLILPRQSQSLYLVQRIRDEAHRVALQYHRRLRAKKQVASWLEGCPGIGPARRKALLKAFGSLNKIKAASEAELAQVPGMTKKAAANLYAYLRVEGSN
ncbi:MAG: excinuclease ABC subunit UvrC [Firmicutes bacterium]|nr:excinuclease ABC subunit UvrC [Bacillota bacterium]